MAQPGQLGRATVAHTSTVIATPRRPRTSKVEPLCGSAPSSDQASTAEPTLAGGGAITAGPTTDNGYQIPFRLPAATQ